LKYAKGLNDTFSTHLSEMQADFMNMPFSDNTFDAVYAIEATCHAPDPV
jgi:ubiquinone/menaquinone biosynthesis C-methylase UbiE